MFHHNVSLYSMRLKTAKSITVLLVVLLFSLNAHSWSRVEDFNEGEVGESVQTTGGMDNSAGGTLHSDEQSLDGSLVAKMSINEGKTGFGGWEVLLDFPKNCELVIAIGFNFICTYPVILILIPQLMAR